MLRDISNFKRNLRIARSSFQMKRLAISRMKVGRNELDTQSEEGRERGGCFWLFQSMRRINI